MPNYDKAAISAQIDGMKSVCADGKKEIRALVEMIIGEKLESAKPAIRRFNTGDVFQSGATILIPVANPDDLYKWSLMGLCRDVPTTWYSDKPRSYVEMLEWLNNTGCRRIGKLGVIRDDGK